MMYILQLPFREKIPMLLSVACAWEGESELNYYDPWVSPPEIPDWDVQVDHYTGVFPFSYSNSPVGS